MVSGVIGYHFLPRVIVPFLYLISTTGDAKQKRNNCEIILKDYSTIIIAREALVALFNALKYAYARSYALNT